MLHDDLDVAAADGALVQIRDLGPEDEAALLRLHQEVSERSLYFRFFTVSRSAAADFVPRLAKPPTANHCSLGAFRQGRLVAVADFERTAQDEAEFALLVADPLHHSGLGTLLVEDLMAAARRAGISRLFGEVLAHNTAMLEVIRDLGVDYTTSVEGDTLHVEFPLAVTQGLTAAIHERERIAGTASLRPVLAPRSVAVVGAGRRQDSVGNVVLRNILDTGFAGPLWAVNRAGAATQGVTAVCTPAELTEAPDLAVIAVPAAEVLGVVDACGRRGVRAAVVVSTGFAEAGPDGVVLQNDLLRIARRHGMRVVGPGSAGVLNLDPAVGLNATAAPDGHRPAGRIGLVSESRDFGVDIAAADACGATLAAYVSCGTKADVGAADLLLAWQDDPRIDVICVELETMTDPQAFARIGREVSRHKPVLAVKAGGTASPARAAAVFRAAGMRPFESTEEMLRAACDLVGRSPEDTTDPPPVERPPGIDFSGAHAFVMQRLGDEPRWLDVADADALVALYGIAVALPAGVPSVFGVQDPEYGPLVVARPDGVVAGEANRDDGSSFRLAPVSPADAAEILPSLGGADSVALSARNDTVVDLLVRVAALVADIPQVSEVRLDGPSGHARVRIARPAAEPDPLRRHLRPALREA